ncbi:ion channel [Pseudomonas fluorescens]|uniref:Uncharacterized protein n=1 Tax=Pseudomonas fluorescens TaxID=294 RepID=A0A5E6QDA1_PSEFL|nr:ion channel [Pseudomonas fluorescens]VVM53268.1 hypothetical protein PS624_00897 [Pseudomonas fluorescens]
MLKKINVWLFSYLAIVLLFSEVYYCIWVARPDSFIINSELNLDPLSDLPLLAWQEMDTHATTSAPNLSEISAKLAGVKAVINELDLKVRSLEQQVDSGRAELAEVGRRNQTITMVNGERYRQDITAEASRSVVDAERVLRAFSERGSSERDHGVAEANLRVKLAEVRVVQAEQMAEAYRYFISNIGQFGDPQLMAQMDQLHDKTQALAREREQACDLLSQKRTELIDVARTWRKQRLDAVSWLDFLFFSIGISTTTTYGDVVGNSRLVRSLIATQLLICVFVMAGFVSSVVSKPGRRDGDTSLSPDPDISGS